MMTIEQLTTAYANMLADNMSTTDNMGKPELSAPLEVLETLIMQRDCNDFNVTYDGPHGRSTAMYIGRDRLSVNSAGHVVFEFNRHYPECKVYKVEPVKVPTAEQVTLNGKFGCE